MSSSEAYEVYTGMMLGDCSLRMDGKNAQLRINLSGIDTIGYLNFVKAHLEKLGITFCDGHPKTRKAISRGKPYDLCRMASTTCAFLTSEYEKWYPSGTKVVPTDVYLSPISLAHWFMGDGSSSRQRGLKAINVVFATNSYNFDSVERLRKLLLGLGISTSRHTIKGRFIIYVRQQSIDTLMGLIEPHIVEPYLYKVKYRGVI